jgi:hypothetical protein
VHCDHEYLNFRGCKFGKSRGTFVDVPYCLSRYDPDPLRVANRMLSFAYKRFDGRVPEPGALDAEDLALLEKVETGFETVGALYNACKFRAAPSVPQNMPGRGHRSGPRGQRLHVRCAPFGSARDRQCRPGPQGALVSDRRGSGGGRRRPCASSCASSTT